MENYCMEKNYLEINKGVELLLNKNKGNSDLQIINSVID
jgi:hypothetical protein